jgi:hypothetical protein
VDLLPVPSCLPGILDLLRPDGAFYFSLNYAGDTRFYPPLKHDRRIYEAYNEDMDRRFPALDWQPSRTGILLRQWLAGQGHRIIAEGESDWRLQSAPMLPANLFIANILDTIETALQGMAGLDPWLIARRQMLHAGQLRFRASNRDYFGCVGPRAG